MVIYFVMLVRALQLYFEGAPNKVDSAVKILNQEGEIREINLFVKSPLRTVRAITIFLNTAASSTRRLAREGPE